MTREQIKALLADITKEQLDGIMELHGADLEKQKEKHTVEFEGVKSQLETAQTALKEFEGVDVKDLQGKITQLNADLQTKDTEYQVKLADMEFGVLLDGVIGSSKGKNAKAIKALLNMDTLKSSKNQAEDMKQAIEAVAKENPYLFGEADTNPTPAGGGNPTQVFSKEDIAKMSPAEINQNWDSIQKSL